MYQPAVFLSQTFPHSPFLNAHVAAGYSVYQQQACLQVTIEETPFRKLTAKLQFPEDYPETAVTVHMQSVTLAEGLLERLEASANSAVAAKRGKPHAAVVTDLLVRFVAANCLATAYHDLAQLREMFADNNSWHGEPQLSVSAAYFCPVTLRSS